MEDLCDIFVCTESVLLKVKRCKWKTCVIYLSVLNLYCWRWRDVSGRSVWYICVYWICIVEGGGMQVEDQLRIVNSANLCLMFGRGVKTEQRHHSWRWSIFFVLIRDKFDVNYPLKIIKNNALDLSIKKYIFIRLIIII